MDTTGTIIASRVSCRDLGFMRCVGTCKFKYFAAQMTTYDASIVRACDRRVVASLLCGQAQRSRIKCTVKAAKLFIVWSGFHQLRGPRNWSTI